jgi:hypothetical protein
MGAPIAVSGPNGQESGDFGSVHQHVQDRGRSFLGKVISIDNLTMSIHTPEIKLQSKQ